MEKVKKFIQLGIIYVFNLFPIKKNKIFLFSYYGSQYGCNPKYITEHLENIYKNTFDIIWAFNLPESKQVPSAIRKVKTMSLRYFYELSTAKIVITNFRTTDLFIKRKHQYYIQTWHSSLRLKKVEQDAEGGLPRDYVEMAKRDSLKCDLLLSGCKFSTDIFKRSFWYDGEIFEHGTPRNDLLVQNNIHKRTDVLEKLTISRHLKVLLYAPTFRKDNRLDMYDLDFVKLQAQLKEKFGDEWIVLVKLHPHLISKSDQLIYGKNVIDVTTYDDVQELLLIADVLISDYSSLIFDFLITKRPCFLYVPDLNEYISEDRELYFTLTELPFINAISNDDLLRKIVGFKENKYKDNVSSFLRRITSYESGRANKYLVERVYDICFINERREIDEAI